MEKKISKFSIESMIFNLIDDDYMNNAKTPFNSIQMDHE